MIYIEVGITIILCKNTIFLFQYTQNILCTSIHTELNILFTGIPQGILFCYAIHLEVSKLLFVSLKIQTFPQIAPNKHGGMHSDNTMYSGVLRGTKSPKNFWYFLVKKYTRKK